MSRDGVQRTARPTFTVLQSTLSSQPRPYESREIRQQIAGCVNEHHCKEIFCPGPDYAERDATYCENNDRIRNRIECARV